MNNQLKSTRMEVVSPELEVPSRHLATGLKKTRNPQVWIAGILVKIEHGTPRTRSSVDTLWTIRKFRY